MKQKCKFLLFLQLMEFSISITNLGHAKIERVIDEMGGLCLFA